MNTLSLKSSLVEMRILLRSTTPHNGAKGVVVLTSTRGELTLEDFPMKFLLIPNQKAHELPHIFVFDCVSIASIPCGLLLLDTLHKSAVYYTSNGQHGRVMSIEELPRERHLYRCSGELTEPQIGILQAQRVQVQYVYARATDTTTFYLSGHVTPEIQRRFPGAFVNILSDDVLKAMRPARRILLDAKPAMPRKTVYGSINLSHLGTSISPLTPCPS